MKNLKGKPVFDAIDQRSISHIQKLQKSHLFPTLGIIRVGQREDDISYERSIIRKCKKIGLQFEVFEFKMDIQNADFLDAITEINSNPLIHGILMFRPLPAHLNYEEVLLRFKTEKDIDGMLPKNLGLVLTGEKNGFAPCTAEAVVEILKFYEVPIEGADISIINHSNVVGKPLAMMLTNAGATTTICHHYTRNLKDVMKEKDIVISAIGRAKFFGSDYFSKDQFVIDVGINIDDEGQLCGDINYDEIITRSAGVTPVPGGVGGVTTSLLLRNVVKACINQNNINTKILEVS